MENYVNSKELLSNKISENPRKGFFTELLDRGMNKIKKRIDFRTLRHFELTFAPSHGRFHGKRCILGHPNVHIYENILKYQAI